MTDNFNTKIIAMTMPFEYTGLSNSNDLIAYCARVSNPNNQMNLDTSEKLLKYLINNKHWSPFEMVNIVMQIETTRDIARQILRHRSFSFQEFSQRYAAVNNDSFVLRDIRFQDVKNRQNSIEHNDYMSREDINDWNLKEEWRMAQSNLIREIKHIYEKMLNRGVAKEVARAILPEGLTMSNMYVNGTLRSWIHYCLVRMDKSTQKEHRVIAEEIWSKLSKPFPFLKEISIND